MDHGSLTISVQSEARYVIIAAAGEIGIFTVSRLREVLLALADSGQPVIADLNRATFLSAAGLGALAGAARRAAARGTSLHVVCAPPQTRQLLRQAGLERTLRLARTLPEALRALPAVADPAARLPRPVPAAPGGDGDDPH